VESASYQEGIDGPAAGDALDVRLKLYYSFKVV